METLLELRKLQVKYGPLTAVKGVDMIVPRGQIVAILGANGPANRPSSRRSAA
jgi:branched-chain amino acid transport system ATP-binding protein